MKSYKATVSFAGELSMAIGEVRELESSLAKPLLKCGYIEEVAKKENKPDKHSSDSKPSKRTSRKSE